MKQNRILIVDDDPAILRLLSLCVNRRGWEVYAAKNGPEALRIFERDRFNLLLSDVHLGAEMDGIEVAKMLLNIEPRLTVVMMSGMPSTADRVKAAGVGSFLAKPLSLGKVAGLLESHRAHHFHDARQRILIVEDDGVQLGEYSRGLQERGYRIAQAQSAEEAIDLVARGQFDAILSDNVLPGMTGLRAIPELRRRSQAPILLMTNYPSPDLERDALLLGAAAVLKKPLDLERLDLELSRSRVSWIN